MCVCLCVRIFFFLVYVQASVRGKKMEKKVRCKFNFSAKLNFLLPKKIAHNIFFLLVKRTIYNIKLNKELQKKNSFMVSSSKM